LTLTILILNPGIQNSIVIDSVNDVCDHIIKFYKNQLLENHPRDDYRELLELTVIFLGRKLSSDII